MKYCKNCKHYPKWYNLPRRLFGIECLKKNKVDTAFKRKSIFLDCEFKNISNNCVDYEEYNSKNYLNNSAKRYKKEQPNG